MSSAGQMNLARKNWRRGWLKPKSSSLKVNHQLPQGPVHRPGEAYDRAQMQTLPTRSEQYNQHFKAFWLNDNLVIYRYLVNK